MSKTNRSRIVVVLATVLFALSLWPAVTFANRIEPFALAPELESALVIVKAETLLRHRQRSCGI